MYCDLIVHFISLCIHYLSHSSSLVPPPSASVTRYCLSTIFFIQVMKIKRERGFCCSLEYFSLLTSVTPHPVVRVSRIPCCIFPVGNRASNTTRITSSQLPSNIIHAVRHSPSWTTCGRHFDRSLWRSALSRC